MKKISLFACILFSGLILLDSCRKIEGCTDPSAENYYEFAEVEDGSCAYLSDGYVGTYEAIDTLYWITNAQVVTDTIYYSFTISRVDNLNMKIANFSMCGNDLSAAVHSDKEFLIEQQESCLDLRGGFKLEGGVLSYSYFKYPSDGVQRWSGAAIMQ